MKVKSILNKAYIHKKVLYNHCVSFITSNVNEVISGSVFIAINHDDINIAVAKGAKTIIYQDRIIKNNPLINYVLVYNIRKAKAMLYKAYYSYVFRYIKLIGVVGTNGKSTTSKLISDFLNYKGVKSLWIGTHGVLYTDEEYKTSNTTIDIALFYRHALHAIHKGYKYIVMEVSSIGISQLRTLGLTFYRLVFTSFGLDHLDYHKNKEEYLFTKMVPFIKLNSLAILNADDDEFLNFYKYLDIDCYTYGTRNEADIMATDIHNIDGSLCFRIQDYAFKTNFYGDFFTINVLAFITTLKSLGFNMFDFKKFLGKYKPLNGRMELIKYKNNKIVIDYAHNPAALKKCLEFLKKDSPRRLIAVGGAGGNREKEKRPKIGDLLNEYADEVIICDDNPRNEDSLEIAEAIKGNYNFEIILDRKLAIKKAFAKLKEYDVLLIFGKGNEEEIIYNNMQIMHNDKDYVLSLIN